MRTDGPQGIDMAPRPLILDCDPGVDDAVALLLAFAARDSLALAGITTVAGNVGLARTTRNARALRELAGREDVPIVEGCARPLVRPPVEAADFHGASGLGDLELPEPRLPAASGHAAQFIVESVLASAPRSLTLAATGPLTNLAAALALEPRIATLVREVVFMGGARREGGNITASAEYNVYADPHAAQRVCAADWPVVAIGLDASHQVRSTAARVAAIRSLGSAVASATAELLEFSNAIEARLGGRDGAPLHDPCVLAYLLAPQLFETADCDLQVETDSPLTIGHTAVEFRNPHGAPRHVRWATRADAQGVFALLAARLAAYGTRHVDGGGP
jgi:purine nucleosidase